MRTNRTVLATALVAVMLMAGCNRDAETPPAGAGIDTPPDAAEPAAPVVEPPEPAMDETVTDETVAPEEAAPFDVATVAVSDTALGEWPYVTAPDGYAFESARTLDLSQVPFWTGQVLQPVEGKVFEARIRAVGEKSHSRFEVLKRFDQALTELGAQKITTSEIPDDVIRDQLPKDFGVEFNAGAGGYYRGQEVSTYVLRRSDRVVWYKIYSDGSDGSVLIAESEDVPVTSS